MLYNDISCYTNIQHVIHIYICIDIYIYIYHVMQVYNIWYKYVGCCSSTQQILQTYSLCTSIQHIEAVTCYTGIWHIRQGYTHCARFTYTCVHKERGRNSTAWGVDKGIRHRIARSIDVDYSQISKPHFSIVFLWFIDLGTKQPDNPTTDPPTHQTAPRLNEQTAITGVNTWPPEQ